MLHYHIFSVTIFPVAIALPLVSADETATASLATSTSGGDIFTPEQREEIAKTEQRFEFQAEVNRMMDIIINSLYTNRDIFLRELISNAADALDKIRFLSLTDKSILGEGSNAELDVRIKFDKPSRTLTITDKGVGMSKDELVKNLGILARSGTTEFLEAATSGKGDALSLIGQFGVGFYSVYLVADRVVVTSKSAKDDNQYIWESTANSTFTVARDPRGNTLGRGTEITLHLKPDADEYLNENKLTELATKYSQFINFPIYIEVPKTVEEEVEVVDETKKNDDDKKDKDVIVSEEEDANKPKTTKKKISKTVVEDKRVNAVKAIWTRPPSEITEEEYNEFYKEIVKGTNTFDTTPLNKLHFSAEGDISFKSLLYIPSKAEHGLYDRFYEKSNALKLYVRRVLITDEFKDFLPRYMNFVKGVVDSDDLPLNVNRETLAQSRVLKVMSKKLSRKVLEMLRKMASDEKTAIEEIEEEEKEKKEKDEATLKAEEDAKSEEEKAEEKKKKEQREKNKKIYTSFWDEFGKSIKLGVLDDRNNKQQLTKLLRFKSTKAGDGKYVSLEDYIDRMAKTQKHIYYITGESEEAVKASPFVVAAEKKGIEVLLMTDPLDEYLVQSVPDFDGTPLQSLSKEGVSFGDEKKNLLKKQEEEFTPLTKWLKDVYGSKIEKVIVSQRLGNTPMAIVASQYGWSANMERIIKGQAFSDQKQNQYMVGRRVVEVNPYHPMIKQLNTKATTEEGKEESKDKAMLLYDAALLQSGFGLDKPEDFALRVHRVLSSSLNVPADAGIESEPENDLPDDTPATTTTTDSTTSTTTDSTTTTTSDSTTGSTIEGIKVETSAAPKDEL